MALRSHQPSTIPAAAPARRMPSGFWTDSTWITSAPRQPSSHVADGPAHHAVKSMTRRPCNGKANGGRPASSPGRAVGAAGRSCSPRRGAGRGAGAAWSSST